jgi:CheY-like chemotaxis protein
MTTGSPTNPPEVLLVEKNPADARLTEEILKDSEYTLKLSVVETGKRQSLTSAARMSMPPPLGPI